MLGRQQRDPDFGRRPIAGDGKFFVPVIGNSDRRLCLARQIDRRCRLDANRALGPEPAADMIGDHAHLVMFELVALGDQLHHVEHGLCRNVHREAIAIEAGDGGMRLQTRMRLRAGAEGLFDQQRISRFTGIGDPVPRFPGAL